MSTDKEKTNNLPAPQTPKASQSERFTQMVMNEFGANAGAVSLTNFQRKLIQNYFIKLDATLKENERKRMAKAEDKRDLLAFTWENVNMQKLAVDVVSFSSVGLDPIQANQINLIPYKNTSSNKYDITFMMGYRGIEIKAKKYGLEMPDDVVVELVYSNDEFKSIKKDKNNPIESYTFNVTDDFNRGAIRGGFYYHSFTDHPEKNKLRTFSLADIEKRKPAYASAEFWGGEKDKWENGRKNGKETVEGWFDEMCWKTIYRAAYNDITIDSEKIDEHFLRTLEADVRDNVADRVKGEIAANANRSELTFEDANVVEDKKLTEGEPKKPEASEEKQPGSSVPENSNSKPIQPQIQF